jgi:dTDP-4-amino-4,6-dideoxygalactose transaminase|tara:strand:- start:7764 stop:8684 length:921 start_codon:yes stop_codon:yes gene_type:complete
VIQLFHINKHTIDTSEFSNLLHDDVVTEFEDKIAKYVGAKYACSINSATNAIFLSLLNKDVVVDLPSMIPPVVANAILTSGNKINFIDDVNWVGHSYTLHQFDDYKIVDSAQRLEENQFKNECNPNDLMLFSFYPTKPLGGSDGGMIVTDDYEKYKWFKEAVLNGMTYANNNWERTISFPGYKMYMNSIQAQICLNNFELFDDKMTSLSFLSDIYNKELGYNNSSSHLYRIEVSDNQRFINRMREDNIICGMHYSALHLNPIYNKGIIFECPKSEKLQSITVSLPMNENLIDEDVHYIIEKVRKNI